MSIAHGLNSPSGVRNLCVDSPRFEQYRHNLKMCGTERHLAGESMICPGTITGCFSSRSRLYNGLNSSFPPPPPPPHPHPERRDRMPFLSLFLSLSLSAETAPEYYQYICLSVYLSIYTLFHEIFSTFFWNKISLPERRNKSLKEKCFGNNKNVLFLNLNDKIIEQEMNKLAIHTHVNFRPRNAMFLLLNNYVFPDWQR